MASGNSLNGSTDEQTPDWNIVMLVELTLIFRQHTLKMQYLEYKYLVLQIIENQDLKFGTWDNFSKYKISIVTLIFIYNLNPTATITNMECIFRKLNDEYSRVPLRQWGN